MIHDDGLFISHAHLLASGRWLGPFSQFTLMKGPGYPAFLALSACSGLPISITQAIFSCVAVGGLSWVIWRMSGSCTLAFATFILVLWNPGPVTLRLLRQAIYPAQLLLFLAASSYALFCVTKLGRVILWGSIAGAILGWFWLTREEGAWVLPGVILLALGGALSAWRTCSIRLPVIATGCMVFVCSMVLVAFRVANLVAYGSIIGVDTKEPNFVGALNALQSVEVGEPILFVPVNGRARKKIYEVSPAFASLQPYLDPPGGSPWQKFGCEVYPWTCGEIASAWFMWALRDAAATAGYYQTPARATAFFRDLREEVRSACGQGRLVCRSWSIPIMPHVTGDQVRQIPAELARAVSLLLFRPPPPLVEGPSTGNPPDVLGAWGFLNYPFRMPLSETASIEHQLRTFSERPRSWLGRHITDVAAISPAGSCLGFFDFASSYGFEGGAQVNGWAWSLREKVAPSQILLADAAGTIVGLATVGLARPDVSAASLVVTDEKTGWHGYSKGANSVSAYGVIDGGREVCLLSGSFDIASAPADPVETITSDRRVRLALWLRAFLVGAYRFLMPVLFCSGLVAMLFSTWTLGAIRAAADPILVLAAVTWILMFSLMVLLVLISVSLSFVINYSYISPAYPLSCIAALLSIWSAIRLFAPKAWWRTR